MHECELVIHTNSPILVSPAACFLVVLEMGHDSYLKIKLGRRLPKPVNRILWFKKVQKPQHERAKKILLFWLFIFQPGGCGCLVGLWLQNMDRNRKFAVQLAKILEFVVEIGHLVGRSIKNSKNFFLVFATIHEICLKLAISRSTKPPWTLKVAFLDRARWFKWGDPAWGGFWDLRLGWAGNCHSLWHHGCPLFTPIRPRPRVAEPVAL